MTHPLTDEICLQIMDANDQSNEDDMRAAANWQLKQVIEWLNFGYQTDPNLSREMKQSGRLKAIAIALEKTMRPQQEDN
ncbi:MAG: hypothetical protein GY880_26145 [Planctomycetaceae bacterium]|nr:hypothetical protein [Planctomycetaceae bacterium]